MSTTQHSINLSSQGTALKSLFTGYLVVVAVGYLMALVQIQFTRLLLVFSVSYLLKHAL